MAEHEKGRQVNPVHWWGEHHECPGCGHESHYEGKGFPEMEARLKELERNIHAAKAKPKRSEKTHYTKVEAVEMSGMKPQNFITVPDGWEPGTKVKVVEVLEDE